MIYFTADTHFLHESIIRFCHRPFYTCEAMDEKMIENWNSVVSETDTVYHLGDFCFGNSALKKELGARLNGYKFLCIGSHDKQIPNGIFEKIDYCFFIRPKINGVPQGIFLSHYLHKVWDESHYGAYHFYAHSHGRMNAYAEQEGKLLDVGVDNFNFTPVSLDEAIRIMATRPRNFNDIHKKREEKNALQGC